MLKEKLIDWLIMISDGVEFGGGNLPQIETQKVRQTLKQFSDVVYRELVGLGIGRAHMPFVGTTNFISILDKTALHLVIDNVPVNGPPTHQYIDMREYLSSLESWIQTAIHEFGYQRPIGISFPATSIEPSDPMRENAFREVAKKIQSNVEESLKVARVNLPNGYEHYSQYLDSFLKDHPVFDRNVFLMMRFDEGEHFIEIEKSVRKEADKYGLHVIRADDKDYTGDLWSNVCLYMLCSKYGIVVYEQIENRDFNPSVSIELGFMSAMNRRCLILKDKRMPKMPTDIIGKLYKEFDTYHIAETIAVCMDSWVHDIAIV